MLAVGGERMFPLTFCGYAQVMYESGQVVYFRVYHIAGLHIYLE